MAEQAQEKLPENVVFIGRKPSMSYVLGVITQLSNGQKEVFIKARGRAISKAVDVAEIVRRKFVQDAKISNVEIGTEERQLENGQKINVSTINITITK
ncbi:MAG: DNA-binding protein Alba [Candidatus Aenigmatarchaeota archaeon]|nr:DNA-binding protein Alba [Candidatus Aenigmarchaeota archaeon]